MSDRPIYVTKAALPDFDEYEKYLKIIWDTGILTNNGALCKAFADELRRYLSVNFLELVGNGTLALQLAIKALGLQGEIITTPYSYVATTNAILWEHCQPIFVDIETNSFGINPRLIEEAITPNTTAILATHVYGYPCHVHALKEIADRHGLKIIYDAAHAFGVKLGGESLLNFGDISTLSLHATKLFHSAEGGAVVCNSEALSRDVFLKSRFGHLGEDQYYDVGINAKMSELHAAMGLALMPKVESLINDRKRVSETYDEYLSDINLLRPKTGTELEYNYAYYPVVFESHQKMMHVRETFVKNNVFPRRYFYPSLNTLSFLDAELKRSCPVSEDIASRVLCLPLYPGLETQEIEKICSLVASCYSVAG